MGSGLSTFIDYTSDAEQEQTDRYVVKSGSSKLMCRLNNNDEPLKSPKPNLPFDILESIVMLAEDQQTLHIWQLVSFDTYQAATPLLYSRGATLATSRGYRSFLQGSSSHSRKLGGDHCVRLMPKPTLLPRVYAIKIAGAINFDRLHLLSCFDTPAECFRGLRKLWIAKDPIPYKALYPSAHVDTWMKKIELSDLHLGEEGATSLLGPAFTLIRLGTLIAESRGPLPMVIRQYESVYLRYLSYHKEQVTLEIVLSRDLSEVFIDERFERLIEKVLALKPKVLRVYGAGSPAPRRALIDNEKVSFIFPGVVREDQSDIIGSEADCQAAVSDILNRIVPHYAGLGKSWEFKLLSELPSFFG